MSICDNCSYLINNCYTVEKNLKYHIIHWSILKPEWFWWQNPFLISHAIKCLLSNADKVPEITFEITAVAPMNAVHSLGLFHLLQRWQSLPIRCSILWTELYRANTFNFIRIYMYAGTSTLVFTACMHAETPAAAIPLPYHHPSQNLPCWSLL